MSTPIIGDETFQRILGDLEQGLRAIGDRRCVLNITLSLDGAQFHVAFDARPDYPDKLDEVLNSADQPDPAGRAIAAEIRWLWDIYDYEERFLCLVTAGLSMQVAVVPKPWLTDAEGALPHEHCVCGARRGAHPDHDADHETFDMYKSAERLLEVLFEEHSIPESHGISHARRVFAHTHAALASHSDPVDRATQQAVLLAALLHDADDRKYFNSEAVNSDSQADNINAARILDEVLATSADRDVIRSTALEAISYVSASKNGNSIPQAALQNPVLLFPRWADRIEAIGEIGVVRCWQYTTEVGRPLYTEDTPCPSLASEALALASPALFEEYQARGKSASMVDHFFDKLIQVARPLAEHANPYISAQGRLGLEPLLEICVAPRPEGLEARIELAKARVREQPGLI